MDKYKVEIISKPDLFSGRTGLELKPALKTAVEALENPLPGTSRIRVVHEETDRPLLNLVRKDDGEWDVIWEQISDSFG